MGGWSVAGFDRAEQGVGERLKYCDGTSQTATCINIGLIDFQSDCGGSRLLYR
jgi:hypothetical protein